MLCILAFIIFLIFFPILGFFPEYRELFRKSFVCVFNRVTLKPCDINLGEELKSKFLAKLYVRVPKVAKFLEKHFAALALIFVIINIWSVVSVINSGMNLYVYGSCDAATGESCSLSGEACGAGSSLGLEQAVSEGRMLEYVVQPFKIWEETVSKIPDRAKNWEAKDYLTTNPSFKGTFKADNKYATEFIDPSCQFCKELYKNIVATDFSSRYNLSYTLYPIPDTTKAGMENGGYKFRASKMLSQYIEAIKIFEKNTSPEALSVGNSKDWQFLGLMFAEDAQYGTVQNKFNIGLNRDQFEPEIQKMLASLGYNPEQINQIKSISKSPEVDNILKNNADIVQNKVKTIRIPTIIFNGQRYDKVIKDELKN